LGGAVASASLDSKGFIVILGSACLILSSFNQLLKVLWRKYSKRIRPIFVGEEGRKKV
jgi:hypothetical protein